MLKDTPASSDGSKALNERLLLFVLATIQFTSVLDFLIILPLGPQYMRVFSIGTAQFGWIVSAYAISAAISGVAACFFLDRFDRKRALLTLYLGFTLGTLFCALAPTYPLLVAARAVAGAFGGVVGALILAIVSAYAISAAISGVAACFFLDRFDRKRALLTLYLGFTLGTFFCALAPTYP